MALAEKRVDLDVVVVSYRTPEDLARFVDSYWEVEYPALVDAGLSADLTVVDVWADQSLGDRGHGLFSGPERFGSLLSLARNVGYSGAANAAAAVTGGRYVGIFNADCWFDPALDSGCLARLVEFMDGPMSARIGVCGPAQVDSNDLVTSAGVFGALTAPETRAFHEPWRDGLAKNSKALTVSGSAYVVRRSMWNELTACPLYRQAAPSAAGAFLPTPHYFEETFCSYHAIAHDWQVWFVGTARMRHEWHKSTPVGTMTELFQESRELFRKACDLHGIPRN